MKKLAIYDDQTGRLEALDPGRATGIPLPAARVVNVAPAAGTVGGEMVYESTTGRGLIWDGSNWRDVTATAILRYPDDPSLLADRNQPVGAYAVSGSTGNLYIWTATGWQKMGTQEYTTVMTLLQDTPAVGTIGLALDEDSLWEYSPNGWRSISPRMLPDTAAVVAWAAPTLTAGVNLGDRAIALDVDVQFIRSATGWRPMSIWDAPRATILAKMPTAADPFPLNGQEAVATDTGEVFAFVNGGWVQDPIQHYPTEADLLVATPPDGTLAWGDDNGLIYARFNGGWRRANSPTSTVGPQPATPASGDLNYDPARGLTVYDGGGWQGVGVGTPLGAILAYPNATPPNDWLICDGSAIPAQYAGLIALIGANTPNLTGQFIKGGTPEAGFTRHSDTTRRPRTHDFTGSAATNGDHVHPVQTGASGHEVYYSSHQTNIAFNDGGQTWTVTNMQKRDAPAYMYSAGAHSHNVTINGGGDAETAPKHVIMLYIIKATP